jgi:hypothetical protein
VINYGKKTGFLFEKEFFGGLEEFFGVLKVLFRVLVVLCRVSKQFLRFLSKNF